MEDLKGTILQKLKTKFPDVSFQEKEFRGDLTISFDKKQITDVASFLKNDKELDFNRITDVTAIDWARKKQRFSVVYILYSIKNKINIRLMVDLEEDDASVETVCNIWQAANWYEREAYDMYGITFTNHPDLRRMYMPEEYEYHPLRKDYPLMGHPGDLSLPKK